MIESFSNKFKHAVEIFVTSREAHSREDFYSAYACHGKNQGSARDVHAPMQNHSITPAPGVKSVNRPAYMCLIKQLTLKTSLI